jgi:hypothetical protein
MAPSFNLTQFTESKSRIYKQLHLIRIKSSAVHRIQMNVTTIATICNRQQHLPQRPLFKACLTNKILLRFISSHQYLNSEQPEQTSNAFAVGGYFIPPTKRSCILHTNKMMRKSRQPTEEIRPHIVEFNKYTLQVHHKSYINQFA